MDFAGDRLCPHSFVCFFAGLYKPRGRRHSLGDDPSLAIGNVGRISSVSMLLGGLVIFLPSLLIVMLCRGQVLGGADIKVFAACGLMLGFVGGTVGFCIGLLFAIVFNLIYNKVKHKSNKEAFPMLPFLSVGFMIGYFM